MYVLQQCAVGANAENASYPVLRMKAGVDDAIHILQCKKSTEKGKGLSSIEQQTRLYKSIMRRCITHQVQIVKLCLVRVGL